MTAAEWALPATIVLLASIAGLFFYANDRLAPAADVDLASSRELPTGLKLDDDPCLDPNTHRCYGCPECNYAVDYFRTIVDASAWDRAAADLGVPPQEENQP